MSVNSKMTAIADNIRGKTGKTEPLTLDDMALAVDDVHEAGKLDKFEEFKTKISEYIDVPDDIAPDDMVDLLFEKFAVGRTGVGRSLFAYSHYKKFPPIDTSGLTEMQQFLQLTEAEEVEIDLSSITNAYQFLYRAKKLKKITLRNMSKNGSACSLNMMFWISGGYQNAALEELTGLNVEYSTNNNAILTYQNKLVTLRMEGFIKIGFDVSTCTSLSHESLLNIGEHLFDYSNDTSGEEHTMILGSKNIEKLTDDELEIFSAKGWLYQ